MGDWQLVLDIEVYCPGNLIKASIVSFGELCLPASASEADTSAMSVCTHESE